MASQYTAPHAADGSLLDHLGRYAFAARFVPGKRVVDLAPGPGTELLQRAGAAVLAGPDVRGGPFDVVIAFDGNDPRPLLSRCRELVREDGLLLVALPSTAEARAEWEGALDAVFSQRRTVAVRFAFTAAARGDEVHAGDDGEADGHIAICSPAVVCLPPGGTTLPARVLAEYVEAEARAWRAVADDRDRALEEVERVNSFLERQNSEQAQEIDQLRQARHDLERRLQQALTLSLRRRVARKLSALFPQQTLTGRALRGGLQMAKRLLKRSA